jgi:hypothetical protein
MDHIAPISQTHQGFFVPEMQYPLSIGRLNGLFEHQQELRDTGLARTVCPTENGQGSQSDGPAVPPSLEILDFDLLQHVKLII